MAYSSNITDLIEPNPQKSVGDAINDTLQAVLDIAAHDVEQAGEQISSEFLKISSLAKGEAALVETMIAHFNNIRLGDKTTSFDQFCMYLNSTLALAVEKNILASYVVNQSVDALEKLTHRISLLQQDMEKNTAKRSPQSRELSECLYDIKKVQDSLAGIILDNSEKERWLKDMTVIEGIARTAPQRNGDFMAVSRRSAELSEQIQSICNQIVMLMQFQDRNSQIIANIKSIVSRYHTLTQIKTPDICTHNDQEHADMLKRDIKMTEIRKIFDLHLKNRDSTILHEPAADKDDNAELF